MPVRCKFKCIGSEKIEGYGDHKFHWNYRFSPVVGGSEENKSFFASTPSGEIKFQALAGELFEVGKEYYIDLTPAGL